MTLNQKMQKNHRSSLRNLETGYLTISAQIATTVREDLRFLIESIIAEIVG